MEERVARLEANVAHIQSDVTDLKTDVRELRRDLTSFRVDWEKSMSSLKTWALLLYFGLATSMIGIMARGFGWL